MKKIAILIASLAGFAALTVSAQQSASSYSVTADFSYTSNYVFRGIENADSAFTPSVEISVDDFYLGLWTMQPINNKKGGDKWNNEIDIYAGYNYKINSQFAIETIATYYWYPEAEGAETSKSYELGVGGTYTYRGLSANAYLYYDFRLQAFTTVGSVGYSFPIEKLGTSIDVAFYVGNVGIRDWYPDSNVPSVKQSYLYWGFDLSVPYHLTDRATITAGLHYATNDNLPNNISDNKLWFTLGLGVRF